MKIFHGTTSTRLPSIYRDGIRPRGQASGNWAGEAASRADAVYLTDAHPLHYALQAMLRELHERDSHDYKRDAEHQGRAWLVQADERKRRKLAKEMERQARRREERAAILPAVIEIEVGRLNPLEASLRTLGTCAHIGTIPASAITRVAVVEPVKAPELCHYARSNICTIVRYHEVGAQLRDLTRWMFGDASPYFDGPPESERAGIRIIEPHKPQGGARHAA